MNYRLEENNIIMAPFENFSLALTLDCGQAFRFAEKDGVWEGLVGKKKIKAMQRENGEVVFYDTSEEEFCGFISDYFDFNTDYNQLKELYKIDKTMEKAVDFCGGIRILKQESWETLCSFIISQNNNIKRIKGIIDRLCEAFGEETKEGYLFPRPEVLADKTPEELSFLRAGFRDKYIIDAARKVSSGEVDFEKIKTASLEDAIEELTKIRGVGLKVASCVLLYGFNRKDAFPVDVWIKRALEEFYPEGFPSEFYETRGIAQQFLFHYIRNKEETDI